MYLRSITLAGFKTFALRTEIRFEGGVTAIVGPNGSGKTNIVDALKWVLGETQARDLRGRRMEDVLFAGGARRPRAASAEVVLTIDNSEGRLPVDFGEVSIRRRADRGGQSDYFLNGTRVRRRDVLDLLASTGLTIDSYALINQSDIEAIAMSAAEDRRLLIEEAAQVRGIKARRGEAAARLRELSQNLLRLEDVRGEIEPRLEAVRAQAEVARDAAEARARLEVLKGSLLWEEWREVRDVHRRAQSQAASLARRREEAAGLALAAETAFQAARQEVEAAQDLRLQRQRLLGSLRLDLSRAEHELAMARERAGGQTSAAAAARQEVRELEARAEAAAALHRQLESEVARARLEMDAVPADPPAPEEVDEAAARDARKRADAARRAAAGSASALATAHTRRQFLEESAARLRRQVSTAEQGMGAAQAAHAQAERASAEAGTAAAELHRLRAELEGLEALRPAEEAGARRVGDVIIAEPGWEAALSAVLGPLVDAFVTAGAPDAERLAAGSSSQRTVFFPGGAETSPIEPRPGSLLANVRCERGYEWLAERLLGHVLAGEGAPPAATRAGVYRDRGVLRAGADPRVELAARRRRMLDRIHELEPLAGRAQELAEAARETGRRRTELKADQSARGRLDEESRLLARAQGAEREEAARLPELEREAAALEEAADALGAEQAERARRLAEHGAELRRLQLERVRWRERIGDLERQAAAVRADLDRIAAARGSRARRAEEAAGAAAAALADLPKLEEAVRQARQDLAGAEADAPEAEAEMAESARRLVALEEARVDARLRLGTLEGSLGLAKREAELALARMEELRARMPEGRAPEDVPGGRAREREMRSLERRLEEIGPTNELAARELAELEERHRTLEEQLADIASARQDLDELVGRLREEEETRYEAVFGAVAANFQEFFRQLTGGGEATLRHAAGDEGPRSGVEIVAQPPRKRTVRSVQMLSSGERSLVALALVLALEEVNPSPFVILDEVEAALDDANVRRFTELLNRLGERRQFLVVTHNYQTMSAASALYGVHLDESGSSHLVSVRLEDVRAEDGARGGVEAAS